jgi:hypothetical protein
MPKIEGWSKLPASIRRHLIERMHDRSINIADLNHLRLCGRGSYPKTFLLRGQAAKGEAL